MSFSWTCTKKLRTLLSRKRLSCRIPPRRFLADNGKFLLPPHMLYFKMISLVGEEHACHVMSNIENHLKEDNSPVMEMRASHGHLTKKLIASGVKKLFVYEKRKIFRTILKEIISPHENRISLHQRTFNDTFFEDNNLPVFNSQYLKQSLPFPCQKSWNDSPSVRIIAAHSNGKVMIVALAHISKNMMYFGMGRPELILTLPVPMWEKLLSHPKKVHFNEYLTAGLLFPDFYECKVLGRIQPPVHYNEGETNDRVSKEEFVTVSISPHRNLNEMASPELLEEYLFFATQTMNGKAKHSYIIPALEKWIPGCGKELVMSGVNCFTRFTELTPKEALKLFVKWKSHPNYNSSIFTYEFKDYLLYNKY